MPDRPLVILTEYLDDEAIAWLSERVELQQCPTDDPGFQSLLERAEGLVIRTYTKVDQQFLDKAPLLKVVGRAGVGLDNVDLEACAKRGIEVVNTPDANTQAVVEYVTSIISGILRPRTRLEESVDPKQWGHLRDDNIVARQMSEMTLGILGLGRIGSRIAQVAGALGFNVIYNDLEQIPEAKRHGAEPVDIGGLLSNSDVLTVHIDGRPSNKGLLSSDKINQLQPTVLLLNTSRGFVLDADALAGFLKSHEEARAVLDVHDPEPIPPDYPLLGLSNAILYPHLASRTRAAQANMSWVVRDVARVLGC
ncbi:MAG: NAD(P)-dependent oxidoreductase [Phycisphaerales bacterium]|nr:NAD(P)-dependent oxidoreductase [Phycisphaerales bacterium]